ncbi:hypothetical protein [Kitasatospora sp. NPDC059462]|uniref:hypothetical protein n=1 Tax=Kitasatospora sp. NPDC059462 TaxID=3346841 RepID=UPI0036B654C3
MYHQLRTVGAMAYGADVQSSDWIALGSIAATLAVGGAAGALAVRANGRSRDANSTAERALRVARESALEAKKTRLAANAPKLWVAPGEVLWPPIQMGVAADAPGAPWPQDNEFRTPADSQVPIGLRYSFTVKNIGPETMITVTGRFAANDPRHQLASFGAVELVLATNDSVTFEMEEHRPLSDWISQYRQRYEQSQAGDVELMAGVGYNDGQDEGVIGHIAIRVACNGIEPVPEHGESWRFASQARITASYEWPPTRVSVLPAVQNYYQSKSANMPLELPEATNG